ncbi:hypothetical protein NDU88_003019 [Pleurodeles waltl]|uniref:Uncharacterized protein n=1 Tax=Pleurodeles waltl TaxID=8319 RepID=A0AAV7UD47_PLEWA|nr:hypothetical protein NDU88_003019 [Pleurodeles waltl]
MLTGDGGLDCPAGTHPAAWYRTCLWHAVTPQGPEKKPEPSTPLPCFLSPSSPRLRPRRATTVPRRRREVWGRLAPEDTSEPGIEGWLRQRSDWDIFMYGKRGEGDEDSAVRQRINQKEATIPTHGSVDCTGCFFSPPVCLGLELAALDHLLTDVPQEEEIKNGYQKVWALYEVLRFLEDCTIKELCAKVDVQKLLLGDGNNDQKEF